MATMELERTLEDVERKPQNAVPVNLEDLRYTHVSEIPELDLTFRIARLYLEKMRRDFRLSPLSMYPSDVRLVSSEDYDKHVAPLVREPSDASYHPSLGLCFVKMGKEDLSDNYQLVNLAYAIVHELVHEGMDSGNPYSDWNEGLTDFIARDIMKIVKRGIFGREQSTRNDRMIELTVPSRSDGIEVDASDAVFYTPGRGAIPYSRFLETYPIKRFRKDAPNAYRALLRDHFRGTDLAVEERLVARAA